jgi:transcriptional regulator with GAF, ATPase, and Fis domain
MTAARSAAEMARLFDDIAAELQAAPDGNSALSTLTDVAVRRVDGAEYAGITVGRENQEFHTLAATHERVFACDKIQYELGAGPCVDAALTRSSYTVDDLRSDPRWPQFGPRCVEQTGIVSMLSIRVYLETDLEVIAGLNMYSREPAAFDEQSEAVAHVLATQGALAVGKAAARAKARNLERALETSREIGMAMGILMSSEKVTREQAFDLLRVASQRTHRKLADIAVDVADTGTLDLPTLQ